MTITIILTLCVLLLFAYVFDLTSSKTKIPSVILLLISGWGAKQASVFFEISIPDLNPILPVLGTVGLILIVLEGSLELELNKSKFSIVGKSVFIALMPMLLMSFLLAYAFQYFGNITYKTALANAIPLAIISSAIAIPSARNLVSSNKEFVTYESSLSDIFGVLFFNFITLNDTIGAKSAGYFLLEIVLMVVISFVATLALAFLLSKSKHHVKFTPIILIIILIYTTSKIYHLPSLIFILLFGLLLGNLDELKKNKWIEKLHPEILNKEVLQFRSLTTEMSFLIRSLFFMLFGFLIETKELLNTDTLVWAMAISIGIFAIRAIHLRLFKLPLTPLLFIAPRGLITILLFLSIPLNQSLKLVNQSLIIQVIILTSLIMMYGLMKTEKVKNGNPEISET